MSQMLAIAGRIQETVALIERLERAVGPGKPAPSVLANLGSLNRRLKVLEIDFLDQTDRQSVDVCTYRMFAAGKRYRLAGFAKALASFQATVSLTYDALKNGPKQKAKMGIEVEEATAFDFAYAYSGSVGVVLTIENERLLIGGTLLDEAVSVVFGMAKSSESTDVAKYAKTLGPAPVRSLYNWASDHVRAETGADIQWLNRREVKAKLLVQQPELEQLRDVIAATSDESIVTMPVKGELTGIDVVTKRFSMTLDNGEQISGTTGEVVNREKPVDVPSRRSALVELKTKTHFATEKVDRIWKLLGFTDVQG